MNTQKKYISLIQLIASIVLVTLANIALADDLNPPAYRGDPLSVYAHWNLIPGSTILDLTSWSSVDDSDPATTLAGFIPDVLVSPDPALTQYDFRVPNWIDTMPIKYLRLQLTWQNTFQPPLNVIAVGYEGATPVPGGITFISPVLPDASGVGAYQYYDIVFKPNPDFEQLQVQMPFDAVLSQVVIDTVSTVPEPATVLMLGLGALGLAKRRRV